MLRFRCYDITLTMLRCCTVTILRCYDIMLLRSYDVMLLRCCDVTPLRCLIRCYDVTTTCQLPLCTERIETRPLNHGITAVFGVLLYTERNKAMKPWNQGHPMRKNVSKILEILFLFQSFLKASLCKLIQIDLLGVFS